MIYIHRYLIRVMLALDINGFCYFLRNTLRETNNISEVRLVNIKRGIIYTMR